MKANLAPIVLFCFNRPKHLQKTLNALKKNLLSKKSTIHIFSDAAKVSKDKKKVEEVRLILKKLNGFGQIKIVLRNKNYGLAKNIVSGISEIFKNENKLIVLEDDIVTSKFFLKYMNEFLNYYKNDKKVASIHGYIYPIKNKYNLKYNFFIKGADCWGWGTWKRAWKKYQHKPEILIKKLKKKNLVNEFNFDDTKNYFRMLRKNLYTDNKSWAVQWYASAFLENMVTLYPKYTYVKNIGIDGTGKNTVLKYDLNSKFISKFKIFKSKKISESLLARKKFKQYFKNTEKNYLQKIYYKIFND